ncbi:GNAT family N-acetyltransferase [Xanthomonas rydalmerensis]|uniref:GNAT family N-acetyltransferase n=1 Tax=Xanthomonas rydalmerensis TaxID=3046274 RepID=A0ABZ0JSE7_9XANT|nr:GNAT family N-acetyltransferase [Xanthomonas sp. DM-2023]WOS42605.1 GNAT family N-acetyltransferase [Xanthomonas sp. DM-2023]WOS46791.1 GNAT family N-acetyltransferase [Xanthomonas sp. DM-2023]WOS50971.1 GNAT family N-acetyltransferase [Xanthomonas sp. DM-2023]WOS55151.1 GNAT family N-acetyltransferase [Xanthomonas sp. DM-2023]WOS59333.1 GNAT family N-acetyltransferase [Xanthomonas sp. DM-2023]
MQIRPATLDDAEAMVAVQNAIFAAGLRKAPTDPATVRATYLQHPDRLQCVLAEDAEGRVLGFQSLRIARPGNAYDVAEGWGIIGTHVDPRGARRGVGSALFRATCAAARGAGLTRIDASIAADNALGQAYYEAIGFRTYRTPPGLVYKVYQLDGDIANG